MQKVFSPLSFFETAYLDLDMPGEEFNALLSSLLRGGGRQAPRRRRRRREACYLCERGTHLGGLTAQASGTTKMLKRRYLVVRAAMAEWAF